ncbi:MAG TPA: hypothetical protein VMS71_06880, partial [Candidatus Acidoferrum sp.]|nr:hypothetical protein [Candidatus Acidoferrum sp.]
MITKSKGVTTLVLSMFLLLLAVPVWAANGKVTFNFYHKIQVGDKTLGPGNCVVSWVSHSPEADVSFLVKDKVVAEAHGKLVERNEKSQSDAVITLKDDSGNERLKEIRFAGKKTVRV